MSDPYKDLPNFSGVTAESQERSRSGDPARFYPSASAGVVDAVTARILNTPRVSLYKNGGGLIASSTVSLVSWDAIEYNSDNMFDLASPGRVTCKTAALWRASAWWTWAVSATGQRGLLIRRTVAATGVQTLYPVGVLGEGHSITAVGAGLYTVHGPLSYEMEMSPGDYVECFVTQFSGGSLAWIAATALARSNGFQISTISLFGSDN